MYGVPEDLPIERFVGDALFQVRLGLDGVHFAFGQAGTMDAVEAKANLTNRSMSRFPSNQTTSMCRTSRLTTGCNRPPCCAVGG